MHTDNLTTTDLDIPFEDMNIPYEEMVFEDLPDIDELLRTTPTVISPPPTAGQTLFSERITIRINRGVLAELKKRAAEQGEKYQTYINLILAQHTGS
jgi:hypothetical protein